MKLSDNTFRNFGVQMSTRIYIILVAIAFICLGVSCSEESEPGLPDSPKERSVCLTLNVDLTENAILSRTRTDEYTFESGGEYEMLQSLRVIIVRVDDAFYETGKVESNRLVFFNRNGLIIGDNLTFLTTPGIKKIYLFGNEKNMPSDFVKFLDEDLVKDEDFTIESKTRISQQTLGTTNTNDSPQNNPISPIYEQTEDNRLYVPMSEECTVTIREPKDYEELNQTAALFITRTLSKFSFEIEKEKENLREIKRIKIIGLSSQSYLLPNNTVYSKEKYDPEGNDDEGRTIESFDVPESATIGEYVFSIPDNLDTNNELNYSYAPKLYFAESKGIVAPESNEDESEGENESCQGIFQCSILLAGEDEYLPPVTLPNLPALPRNTHVIVKIKQSLHEIKFKVTVAPWERGGRAEIDVTEEKNEEISN